jgi:1-deoxy-D-xylulose-5-phosphate reductoisomerase
MPLPRRESKYNDELPMKSLSILGSTGSIGRSSLDVVAAMPDRFRVVALAAGRSIEKLAEQVARFRPHLVSIDRAEDVSRLERLLPAGLGCRVVAGREGLDEAACHADADTVVGGLVGALGLRSAQAAVRAGKRLALANKEPLVVAGELILAEAKKSGAELVPVDSEHSAIHQALRSGRPGEAARLVLTASGGPFRERRLETFDAITVEDALAHPTWKMGPKITIDSATMMNKGLEVIEAHFLFGLPGEKIDAVIHPQSLIHSFVEFVDGSLVAQLAKNDMKFPIVYALSYPERLPNDFGRLDLVALSRLDFYELDARRYPALGLARAALAAGGGMPAVLNAANEVAVAAFLEGKISFPDIVNVVSATMETTGRTAAPASLDEAEEVDRAAREAASVLVRRRPAPVAAR